MLRRKAGLRLRWKGFENIASIEKQLSARRHVSIRLADSYHHVLSVRFSRPVQLDGSLVVRGGPELITKIAAIAGLHDFADLVEPARAANATVYLSSPPAEVRLVPMQSRGSELSEGKG